MSFFANNISLSSSSEGSSPCSIINISKMKLSLIYSFLKSSTERMFSFNSNSRISGTIVSSLKYLKVINGIEFFL